MANHFMKNQLHGQHVDEFLLDILEVLVRARTIPGKTSSSGNLFAA